MGCAIEAIAREERRHLGWLESLVCACIEGQRLQSGGITVRFSRASVSKGCPPTPATDKQKYPGKATCKTDASATQFHRKLSTLLSR